VTDEGLDGLVTSTYCKAWIYAEDDAREPSIRAAPHLQLCAFPSLEWCLECSQHKRYPYNRTFEDAAFDEIVIIHTSGTTGKLVTLLKTHAYLLQVSQNPSIIPMGHGVPWESDPFSAESTGLGV
jgi:acyl-CoA synthetase (AMP-forming)/AMP-acid ligase II